MASEILRAESTLTDRYQTTIPQDIRNALGLDKRDKIAYKLQPDGSVEISRAMPEGEIDPIVGKFLDFLAASVETNPEIVGPLTADLQSRMASLVGGLECDMEATLLDEEE